jgi:hypothetical protein
VGVPLMHQGLGLGVKVRGGLIQKEHG